MSIVLTSRLETMVDDVHAAALAPARRLVTATCIASHAPTAAHEPVVELILRGQDLVAVLVLDQASVDAGLSEDLASA